MPQSIRRDGRLSVEFLLNQTKRSSLCQKTPLVSRDSKAAGQRIKSSWADKLAALETYKQIHAHLLVPRTFQVPFNDSKWPAKTWGMQLGVLVNNLRTRDPPPDQRVQLDALGFVWDIMELHWQVNVLALRTYKEKFGHVRVPQTFRVPTERGWPEETHGMKLGWVATTLRRSRSAMPPWRAMELVQLDFI
ncbi:hypothetical protein LEN26_000139 [Aphanomyces euteiches]|nr:hypothetical protein AeMF1_002370 [Aphanomyces euteiches]KAH9164242.1 hypothetical protein LEN26_000139 [Aphanomyces euteiches]KAH9192718.1 hypothetical protein AeNC1_005310 [Aphanomyces euteiches]